MYFWNVRNEGESGRVTWPQGRATQAYSVYRLWQQEVLTQAVAKRGKATVHQQRGHDADVEDSRKGWPQLGGQQWQKRER